MREVCIEHDLLVITDDPYEYIVFSGTHIPIATLPGMRERTVTVSSLSKTFTCTGWRLGYAIASPSRTDAIRKVHDFLTVGAPAPLQQAATVGYSFDDAYYAKLSAGYQARREYLAGPLRDAGFRFAVPDGAYFFFADFTELSDLDDVAFAKWMAKEIGIATVPGSSFYRPGAADGRRYVRLSGFCKKQETLEIAVDRLSRFRAAV